MWNRVVVVEKKSLADDSIGRILRTELLQQKVVGLESIYWSGAGTRYITPGSKLASGIIHSVD